MQHKPASPEGYSYRFEGESWVLYELPPAEDTYYELSEIEMKAQAYDVITGVSE